MKILIALILITFVSISSISAQNKPDAIVGKWITEKGNCIVEVYKDKNQYKGKVLWFDVKNKKPMDQWTDEKNPNAALRSRKLVGLEILDNLKYDPSSNEWVDGQIYDATTGKKWDSVVWLTNNKQLKVKGYWVFKFLSQTRTFKRVL